MATEKLNSRVAVRCRKRGSPRRIGRAGEGKWLANRNRFCSRRIEECLPMFSGGSAVMESPRGFFRPVALRPHLSVSLPFSVASTSMSLFVSPRFGGGKDRANRREAWPFGRVGGAGSCRFGRRRGGGVWRGPDPWQPRCPRTLSLRPVALRPRLSASLPLSVGGLVTGGEGRGNRGFARICLRGLEV
jgi:hypothetical protein